MHICSHRHVHAYSHTHTLNPHIQQLSLPVYQRWDAHFIANKDNICLSLFYFRFNRNQLYWQVVKHFSAAHLRPPVVKYSHYTSYRFTLCLTFIVTLFLLYCRCILKVQIWPFGPGGPVALQEGEMLVLPSANADERRRSDCRHAERGPRGDRLRVLSGWVCARWTDDILDIAQTVFAAILFNRCRKAKSSSMPASSTNSFLVL